MKRLFQKNKIAPFKIIRLCHMTMLEVLVSMVLTTLILTVLFYFYRDIDWLNTSMEKNEQELFKMIYVENRLADILPRTIYPKDADKDFFFFTDDVSQVTKNNNPSLVFTYDAENDLNKNISNHALGRLFIDPDQNLVLATWPSPKRVKKKTPDQIRMKKEILMENVENLSFEFYVPPEKNRALLQAPKKNTSKQNAPSLLQKVEVESRDSWFTTWKREYRELPAIIKIHLKQKDQKEDITYAFPLPNSDQLIYYDQ